MDKKHLFLERSKINYDSEQRKIMKNRKKIVLCEIKDKKLTGESVIYENQIACADEIVKNLHNRKIINIMVIALTQSGKTGTMSGLIKSYLRDPENLIPIKNIYIITGLSSREWLKQTINRMPNSMQERVFHRDHLTNRFVEDIKNKKNVLIIIDEIQIAAKENQTLYKTFLEAGFYNKQNLMENDIKIVEFTATPDGTIYDLMNWGENSLKLKMVPGNKYTSCFDLKNQNRIFQYKDLCCYNKSTKKIDKKRMTKNISEIKTMIDKFEKPLYHIIRTPNGLLGDVVINNFKTIFGKNIKHHKYDKESEIEDINKILNKKPSKHEFIFIKEKLRCAKTLSKDYLGIVYERFTNTPDDSVIIQGLVGRGTGYDDNKTTIYFTNLGSIERYEILWNSNFEDTSVKWKSKTTKRKCNLLCSTGTYNNPALIDGMLKSDISSDRDEPVIKKFKHFEDVVKFVKNTLGNKRGPNNPKKFKNKSGFYECNVRGVRKVWSKEDMFKERKCNIRNGAGYGFRYCYKDVTRKSTLRFWIIYYEK